MSYQLYPNDLTDREWKYIKPLQWIGVVDFARTVNDKTYWNAGWARASETPPTSVTFLAFPKCADD
jgi:hypothetical protein